MTTNGNGLLLSRRREIASRLREDGANAKARAVRLRFDALYADIEAGALFAKADELEAPERAARDAEEREARDAETQQT
jgi:hypothetical protein